MTDIVMMRCGHSANARSADGSPACVICAGITPDALIVAEAPDLTGRLSECAYCRKTKPSSSNLPFFEYRPQAARDLHYDGCEGWD